MSQNQEIQNNTEVKEKEEQAAVVENPDLKIITLKNPLKVDGGFLNEIKLNFGEMTGADLFKIDAELKAEGHQGFNSIYDQEVLLKISSKASGVIPEDLIRLSFKELVEVTFSARNFFMGY